MKQTCNTLYWSLKAMRKTKQSISDIYHSHSLLMDSDDEHSIHPQKVTEFQISCVRNGKRKITSISVAFHLGSKLSEKVKAHICYTFRHIDPNSKAMEHLLRSINPAYFCSNGLGKKPKLSFFSTNMIWINGKLSEQFRNGKGKKNQRFKYWFEVNCSTNKLWQLHNQAFKSQIKWKPFSLDTKSP